MTVFSSLRYIAGLYPSFNMRANSSLSTSYDQPDGAAARIAEDAPERVSSEGDPRWWSTGDKRTDWLWQPVETGSSENCPVPCD